MKIKDFEKIFENYLQKKQKEVVINNNNNIIYISMNLHILYAVIILRKY